MRPIFIGQDVNGNYAFASEAKALLAICTGATIKPFQPGSYWKSKSEQFVKWYNPVHNLEEVDLATYDEDSALKKTAELLYKSVCKRMMSDRPIGTFLSGGLDSSVVAAMIKKFHQE